MVLRPVRPSCPAGNSSPFGIWHLTHIPPICPAPRLVPSPQHRNFAGIDGSPMKDWLKIGQLCWTALWNHAVPPVFVQQIELSYVGSKKHQFLLWSSLLFEPSSIQKKKNWVSLANCCNPGSCLDRRMKTNLSGVSCCRFVRSHFCRLFSASS